MDKMSVYGGETLKGDVTISGAKNSALPLIFSTLLASGKHVLKNVPNLRDIDSSCQLMDSLGCKTKFSNNTLEIEVAEQLETLAHYDQVRKMRASILVLGPLLSRFKKAKVSLPGGCAIGARPIEMHLDALKAMGANIEVDSGYVVATTDGLKGTTIKLPFATVGGTENTMMAAALAEGETKIINAAREPEIVDLGNYLETMGAKVSGTGTSEITIVGNENLSAGTHEVIPDRIETGTLMVASAITGGDVTLKKCEPEHLRAFIDVLKEMGVDFEENGTTIRVIGKEKYKAINVETAPFPGFPTDLQAQLMTLTLKADGESVISEKVFENRFMHVPELSRLGAKIQTEGRVAKIQGLKEALIGAPVMATDLRASACLILAGLIADGETLVNRIYHLDRGYEKLENKLSQLGGKVKRIKN